MDETFATGTSEPTLSLPAPSSRRACTVQCTKWEGLSAVGMIKPDEQAYVAGSNVEDMADPEDDEEEEDRRRRMVS